MVEKMDLFFRQRHFKIFPDLKKMDPFVSFTPTPRPRSPTHRSPVRHRSPRVTIVPITSSRVPYYPLTPLPRR